MARGSISTATPETFFAQTGGMGDGGGDGPLPGNEHPWQGPAQKLPDNPDHYLSPTGPYAQQENPFHDPASVIAPNPGHTFAEGPRLKAGDMDVVKAGEIKNGNGKIAMPLKYSYSAEEGRTGYQPTNKEDAAKLGKSYAEEKSGRAQFENITHTSAASPVVDEKDYDATMQDAIQMREQPPPQPAHRGGVH